MIASATGQPDGPSEFRRHMEALERLVREVEKGDLDPEEILERCERAEGHYRALDTILTRVEHAAAELQQVAE
jgi:exonuclease VII small subunit